MLFNLFLTLIHARADHYLCGVYLSAWSPATLIEINVYSKPSWSTLDDACSYSASSRRLHLPDESAVLSNRLELDSPLDFGRIASVSHFPDELRSGPLPPAPSRCRQRRMMPGLRSQILNNYEACRQTPCCSHSPVVADSTAVDILSSVVKSRKLALEGE